jgi:hypothetical protein
VTAIGNQKSAGINYSVAFDSNQRIGVANRQSPPSAGGAHAHGNPKYINQVFAAR